MLNVGDTIGSYYVLRRLRSGGMATLFLARRQGAAGFARDVAIKVVNADLAEDLGFVRMFIEEARLCARINHPNVVRVEELGESGGRYFLVMEYIEGWSLSQSLGLLARHGRRLAPDVVASIVVQVADGLHAAHEARGEDGALLGVVHRDVSPQNVLISTDGHVKVIDFGIAKARGRMNLTQPGHVRGKLGYVAPEQVQGDAVDRRADIFALGVVLWETLVMRRLFAADNELGVLHKLLNRPIKPPSAFVPGIPPALDDVVMTALARAPAERFATALAFRQALIEAVSGATAVTSTHLAELLGEVSSAPPAPRVDAAAVALEEHTLETDRDELAPASLAASTPATSNLPDAAPTIVTPAGSRARRTWRIAASAASVMAVAAVLARVAYTPPAVARRASAVAYVAPPAPAPAPAPATPVVAAATTPDAGVAIVAVSDADPTAAARTRSPTHAAARVHRAATHTATRRRRSPISDDLGI